MDKKEEWVIDDNLRMAVKEMAADIRRDLNCKYWEALSEMEKAEVRLVRTLDENQRAVYDVFEEKRRAFYKAAGQIYTKML